MQLCSEDLEVHWDFSVRVHSLTLLALPGACEVTPRPSSWLATLQPPLALVTSPRIGLRHHCRQY
jgi:hypothetical protein